MKKLTEEQEDLVRRLFVAREEQRASDMQRYWANVYAPVDRTAIIVELFWEEYIDIKTIEIKEVEKDMSVSDIPF